MVQVEAHLFLTMPQSWGSCLDSLPHYRHEALVGAHVPDRPAYARRDRLDRGTGGCQRTRCCEKARRDESRRALRSSNV